LKLGGPVAIGRSHHPPFASGIPAHRLSPTHKEEWAPEKVQSGVHGTHGNQPLSKDEDHDGASVFLPLFKQKMFYGNFYKKNPFL
jgi:hypothetical protein